MEDGPLRRPKVYDPEMTIYVSYWRAIEEDSTDPRKELLDLSELCMMKMKRRFKEAYYGLEGLTKKKLGNEEAQSIYECVMKAYHKVKGASLLTGEILESVRERYSDPEGCDDRLCSLIEDYNLIIETQENIINSYESINVK